MSPRPAVRRASRAVLAAATLLSASAMPARAQGVDPELIDRGHRMLRQLREDIEQNYFDSRFRGAALDARVAHADSAIAAAPTPNHVMAAIADFLGGFNDSHTHFYPPSHVAQIDYGFRTTFVGDTCFVTSVRKESDAAKQGLKRGDALLLLDRFKVERHSWHTLAYVYYQLAPREVVRLKVKAAGDAEPKDLTIHAKVTPGERVLDLTSMDVRRRLITEYEDEEEPPHHYYREFGDSVLVWRMPAFIYGDEPAIDRMLERARAHHRVVLDLRNNGGGSVDTELYVAGSFLPGDSFPVFTMKTRAGDSVQYARNKRREPFSGPLVVLINSNSASASEITSRILQLTGRAMIVGDRSMGAVVTSRYFPHEVGGVNRKMSYGASISVADVIMPDGQRLENVGVTPDIIVLPTSEDIVKRRDPQMAKALELLGFTIDPAEAARIFRGDEER